MRRNNLLLTLVCLSGLICFANCHKTPGQKLDRAIDRVKETAEDAKDEIDSKAHQAKKSAKREVNEVRKNIADEIRPR